jgi:phosphinothricin acetyltransferase
VHVAIGGAALPNEASAALHEKLGFERVATFRQVGFKQERWVDVAYWQIML